MYLRRTSVVYRVAKVFRTEAGARAWSAIFGGARVSADKTRVAMAVGKTFGKFAWHVIYTVKVVREMAIKIYVIAIAFCASLHW